MEDDTTYTCHKCGKVSKPGNRPLFADEITCIGCMPVKIYGKTIFADNEKELYRAITGRYSSVIK